MQQTINMLDEITSKCTQHGEILQQLQEANSEVKIRLEKLERSSGGSSAPGSTVAPSSDGSRRPALVIGGWDPDQDAKTTKEQAEHILRSLGPLFRWTSSSCPACAVGMLSCLLMKDLGNPSKPDGNVSKR